MDYPTFLPGWETVGQIGKGGYALVYKIKRTDRFLGDIYSALKVIEIPGDKGEYRMLELEGYNDKSIKAKFEEQVNKIVTESETMFKFKGAPNIVSFEGHNVIETEKGFVVLIKMELLEPLLEYNDRHPLNEGEIVHLGMSICDALKLCSKESIVHRDIKPENILVDKFDNFKLGDFGIARVMEHTMSATRGGTPLFIAPEVYTLKPYNHKVDIYSLGLVLYWFLNELRMPFLPLPPSVPTTSDNESAFIRRMKGEQLPPPVNGCDQLKKVVLKACAFNPDDRYSSAYEFYDALDEVKSALKRKTATYTGNIDLDSYDKDKAVIPSDEVKNMGEAGENNDRKSTLPDIKFIDTPNQDLELTIPLEIDDMLFSDNKPSSKQSKPLKGDAQFQAIEDDKSKPMYDPNIVAPDFSWNILGGILTISGHGKMPDYSDDNEAPWDSEKGEIKSAVISDSITSIGNYAFYECFELSSITISASVTTIGDWAFGRCTNLTSVTIPESVTSIGFGSFSSCEYLTSINVDISNTEYTSAGGVLFNKDKTELIAYPAGKTEKTLTIPDSVKTIKDVSFLNCENITSITISDSVTAIEKWAFYGCKSLAEIKFAGTKSQWNDISKGKDWKKDTNSFMVICKDSTISKFFA